MKNFDTKYPVEGTSALQPNYQTAPISRARIIAFPVVQDPHDARRSQAGIASILRDGTVQGLSFGRMQRWQAVLAGCVLAVLSFVSLLASL